MSQNRFENIVILGAASAIAQATARLFATDGARFVLLGRHPDKLNDVRSDLLARGAKDVDLIVTELSFHDQIETNFAQIARIMPKIDLLLLAYGTLGDQKLCEADPLLAVNEIQNNFTSAAGWLIVFSRYFEQQNHGTLAVISSVSGDRGRKSNYVYGSAKAGLTVFLGGLRHRFSSTPVRVITIKPGYVDTPMTTRFKKGLLFANPEKVAQLIKKGIISGREILYVPGYWRLIMLVIRMIPEPIFKRLNI